MVAESNRNGMSTVKEASTTENSPQIRHRRRCTVHVISWGWANCPVTGCDRSPKLDWLHWGACIAPFGAVLTKHLVAPSCISGLHPPPTCHFCFFITAILLRKSSRSRVESTSKERPVRLSFRVKALIGHVTVQSKANNRQENAQHPKSTGMADQPHIASAEAPVVEVDTHDENDSAYGDDE